MDEQMPYVICYIRKDGRTIQEKVSLAELVLDGKLPADLDEYQGTCDYLPLPFESRVAVYKQKSERATGFVSHELERYEKRKKE